LSGKTDFPKNDSASFSASNWDDVIVSNANGTQPTRIARASLFKKRVAELTARHWDAIIEGAQEFRSQKKARSVLGPVQDELPLDMGDDNDDVLRDSDFDD
jgi:hypothetical protein